MSLSLTVLTSTVVSCLKAAFFHPNRGTELSGEGMKKKSNPLLL